MLCLVAPKVTLLPPVCVQTRSYARSEILVSVWPPTRAAPDMGEGTLVLTGAAPLCCLGITRQQIRPGHKKNRYPSPVF